MDLGTIVTLIVGLFGGGGIVTLVQFFVKRYDDKNRDGDNIRGEIRAIHKDLGRLAERADTGDLNDSRIQLMMLIWHNPKDHRAILKEAEHYFVDLGGDSWIFTKFQEWAHEEKVDVSRILDIHERGIVKK